MVKTHRARGAVSLLSSLYVGVSAVALFTAQAALAQTTPDAPVTNTPRGEVSSSTNPTQATQPAPDPLSAAPPPLASKGSGSAESSTTVGEVVVTGIRQSLASAQAIKRSSDTVVDAITAEDIGALPDRSVTETLQRIPGVAISHFAAVNDPDHLSPEGQNPVIRGLPYVESQFNGRDAFTANRGRAISFQDIPPELLSTVEVYKNQTADQIEGGIAGNINLVTRRPLDTNRDQFAFSLDGNYGDLSKKAGPDVSVLGSKQWDTPYGRFGILGALSYSELFSRQDLSKETTPEERCNAGPGAPCTLNSFGAFNPTTITTTDANGVSHTMPAPASTNPGGIGVLTPGLTPGKSYYIPVGGGITRDDYDRVRKGYSAAAQWESPDRSLMATFQFLRTDTTQQWTEHTLSVVEDTDNGANKIGPLDGTTLQFDKNNILTKGTLSEPGGGGIQQQALTRGVNEGATTDDYSGHLTWHATDRLKLDFDVQYADSTSRDLDLFGVTSTFAVEQLDFTGEFPSQKLLLPASASSAATSPTKKAYTSFNDPNAFFYRSSLDHEDNNSGDEYAVRADGQFDFDHDSFFKDVKFGFRYADRNQTIKSDGYNWGNLSEAWQPGGTVDVSTIKPANIGTYNFGNFLRGNSQGGQSIFGQLGNPALDYASFIKGSQAIIAQEIAQGGSYGYWHPLGQRTVNGQSIVLQNTNPNAPNYSAQADGFHSLGEIATNDEETIGGYLRLDYGARHIEKLGGLTIDGNIGVRYVVTNSNSTGGVVFPNASTIIGNGLVCPPPPPAAGTNPPKYSICSNTPAQQAALIAFANGGIVTNRTNSSYDNFLPSFNFRVAPRDDVQFRFAYSKAITRPSFNDLHNFVNFSGVYDNPAQGGTYNPITTFQANAAGNPLLKPTRSNNFDFTAEWYFNKVGSLTASLFYKQLTNVYAVANGVTSGGVAGADGLSTTPSNNLNTGLPGGTISYTNNGATEPTVFFGVHNNDNQVDVKGIELAYQQTYTMLPSPFDGLGTNLNFTYIDADKLPGQATVLNDANGKPLNNFAFPGISKYNANATAFYEKYGVSARIAYTWRSKYFVVSEDVNYPQLPVYSGDSSSLDGSIFYQIRPKIKVGVEFNNLLNQTTDTFVQINNAGLEAKRNSYTQDRRYTFTVRAAF